MSLSGLARRIFSAAAASYRATPFHQSNKLGGAQQSQSFTDASYHTASVLLIMLPLWASSSMLRILAIDKHVHETCSQIYETWRHRTGEEYSEKELKYIKSFYVLENYRREK